MNAIQYLASLITEDPDDQNNDLQAHNNALQATEYIGKNIDNMHHSSPMLRYVLADPNLKQKLLHAIFMSLIDKPADIIESLMQDEGRLMKFILVMVQNLRSDPDLYQASKKIPYDFGPGDNMDYR